MANTTPEVHANILNHRKYTFKCTNNIKSATNNLQFHINMSEL